MQGSCGTPRITAQGVFCTGYTRAPQRAKYNWKSAFAGGLYLGTAANALGGFFSTFQIPKDLYLKVGAFPEGTLLLAKMLKIWMVQAYFEKVL